MEWRAYVKKYIVLIESFLLGERSAADFDRDYTNEYLGKDRPIRWPEELFHTLDTLFYEVEAYVDDPALRDPPSKNYPGDNGPEELKEAAAKALEELKRSHYVTRDHGGEMPC